MAKTVKEIMSKSPVTATAKDNIYEHQSMR